MNRYFILMFLLVSFVGLVSAQQQGYSCFGPWVMMSGYGYGFGWFFGLIFWILVIVALVLLIAWLMKQLKQKSRYERRNRK